jgi:hypothetical protein
MKVYTSGGSMSWKVREQFRLEVVDRDVRDHREQHDHGREEGHEHLEGDGRCPRDQVPFEQGAGRRTGEISYRLKPSKPGRMMRLAHLIRRRFHSRVQQLAFQPLDHALTRLSGSGRGWVRMGQGTDGDEVHAGFGEATCGGQVMPPEASVSNRPSISSTASRISFGVKLSSMMRCTPPCPTLVPPRPDLASPLRWAGPCLCWPGSIRRGDGLRDTTGEIVVVVLDHDHVVQAHAVVVATSDPHGPFLETHAVPVWSFGYPARGNPCPSTASRNGASGWRSRSCAA